MSFWRELLDMARGTVAATRAQSAIRRARRLQREGRGAEAFLLAVPAFGVLSELAAKDHAPASSILAFDAVFLDQLATEVGQPAAARESVETALRVCEDIAQSSPRLAPKLQQHMDWYRHRLSDTAGQ